MALISLKLPVKPTLNKEIIIFIIVDNSIYLAGFSALGIFNKLITGPLWSKVEEKGHIFDLNPVWLQLKLNLEKYGQNASLLLDEECPIDIIFVTKDIVYEELFRRTKNPEFDALTQECLEIMSWGTYWQMFQIRNFLKLGRQ